MKKTVLAIMAIIIGFSSFAQSNNSASLGHKKLHNKKNHSNKQNTDNLNLSDDQKAQVKIINENFRQQMQDLKKNSSLNANELKDKRKALAEEHKENIKAILTPEQREQAKDRKHNFAKENKGKMRGERFEKMTKDLNLTPQQSTKMNNLNAAFKTNIQSIRQNTSLSQDGKKEQMKSLMKKHKDDMEALLTDKQKEQLKNNRKDKRNETVK